MKPKYFLFFALLQLTLSSQFSWKKFFFGGLIIGLPIVYKILKKQKKKLDSSTPITDDPSKESNAQLITDDSNRESNTQKTESMPQTSQKTSDESKIAISLEKFNEDAEQIIKFLGYSSPDRNELNQIKQYLEKNKTLVIQSDYCYQVTLHSSLVNIGGLNFQEEVLCKSFSKAMWQSFRENFDQYSGNNAKYVTLKIVQLRINAHQNDKEILISLFDLLENKKTFFFKDELIKIIEKNNLPKEVILHIFKIFGSSYLNENIVLKLLQEPNNDIQNILLTSSDKDWLNLIAIGSNTAELAVEKYSEQIIPKIFDEFEDFRIDVIEIYSNAIKKKFHSSEKKIFFFKAIKDLSLSNAIEDITNAFLADNNFFNFLTKKENRASLRELFTTVFSLYYTSYRKSNGYFSFHETIDRSLGENFIRFLPYCLCIEEKVCEDAWKILLKNAKEDWWLKQIQNLNEDFLPFLFLKWKKNSQHEHPSQKINREMNNLFKNITIVKKLLKITVEQYKEDKELYTDISFYIFYDDKYIMDLFDNLFNAEKTKPNRATELLFYLLFMSGEYRFKDPVTEQIRLLNKIINNEYYGDNLEDHYKELTKKIDEIINSEDILFINSLIEKAFLLVGSDEKKFYSVLDFYFRKIANKAYECFKKTSSNEDAFEYPSTNTLFSRTLDLVTLNIDTLQSPLNINDFHKYLDCLNNYKTKFCMRNEEFFVIEKDSPLGYYCKRCNSCYEYNEHVNITNVIRNISKIVEQKNDYKNSILNDNRLLFKLASIYHKKLLIKDQERTNGELIIYNFLNSKINKKDLSIIFSEELIQNTKPEKYIFFSWIEKKVNDNNFFENITKLDDKHYKLLEQYLLTSTRFKESKSMRWRLFLEESDRGCNPALLLNNVSSKKFINYISSLDEKEFEKSPELLIPSLIKESGEKNSQETLPKSVIAFLFGNFCMKKNILQMFDYWEKIKASQKKEISPAYKNLFSLGLLIKIANKVTKSDYFSPFEYICNNIIDMDPENLIGIYDLIELFCKKKIDFLCKEKFNPHSTSYQKIKEVFENSRKKIRENALRDDFEKYDIQCCFKSRDHGMICMHFFVRLLQDIEKNSVDWQKCQFLCLFYLCNPKLFTGSTCQDNYEHWQNHPYISKLLQQSHKLDNIKKYLFHIIENKTKESLDPLPCINPINQKSFLTFFRHNVLTIGNLLTTRGLNALSHLVGLFGKKFLSKPISTPLLQQKIHCLSPKKIIGNVYIRHLLKRHLAHDAPVFNYFLQEKTWENHQKKTGQSLRKKLKAMSDYAVKFSFGVDFRKKHADFIKFSFRENIVRMNIKTFCRMKFVLSKNTYQPHYLKRFSSCSLPPATKNKSCSWIR